MKTKILLFLLSVQLAVQGQVSTQLFGLMRNNEPSELFLTRLDAADSTKSILGTSLYDSLLVVTGTALNPYNGTYNVLSVDKLFSIDIETGDMLTSVDVSLPIENSSMRSLVFNPSDSMFYGIVVQTDDLAGGIFFATVDILTGDVTILSDSSLTTFLMPGRNIIDPFEKIYYMLTDTKLLGIDMYTGEIMTQPTINNPFGVQFDNMSFNCKDGLIYGLIPAIDTQLIYLGTIDPVTGDVSLVLDTAIDTTYFISGIATANSAIDPLTNTYYYLSAGNVKGIDLATGEKVFETSFYDADGRYFGLFHHFQDCYGANETRFATNLNNYELISQPELYPNPARDYLIVRHENIINTLVIYNSAGIEIAIYKVNALEIMIPTHDIPEGIYFIKSLDKIGQVSISTFAKVN